MTNNVSPRPAHVGRQILAGLESTKIKTANDKLATTIDVGSPQVTPEGSPINGQVAVSYGAPVPKTITIVLDTSEYDEDQEVVGYIGDSSQIHQLSCTGCNESENTVTPFIGSATCNRYQVWLNELCSTPYTFSAFSLKVSKTAGATEDIELPEFIHWSRQNLNLEGRNGTIEVENMEDLSGFERSTVRFMDGALLGQDNLFDRNTRWRIPGLKGKRRYKLTFYTAFRKEN